MGIYLKESNKMKKIFLFLISLFFVASIVYADNLDDMEKEYKEYIKAQNELSRIVDIDKRIKAKKELAFKYIKKQIKRR